MENTSEVNKEIGKSNKNNLKLVKGFVLIIVFIFIWFSFVLAQNVKQEDSQKICLVYFTGVGCPHCAKTDPVVLDSLLKKYPSLVIIEYEIYQQQENAPLLLQYAENYDIDMPGVPLIIFNKEKHIIGDSPILKNIDKEVSDIKRNPCPLINNSIDFDELNFTSLLGKPKIWKGERILIKTGTSKINNKLLKNLLTENISAVINQINYTLINPEPVALSGRKVNFENAIKLDGWIFEWNGEKINGTQEVNETGLSYNETQVVKQKLTLAKLVSLAIVDAINPCALAVLILMLIAILTYNPKKKRNVLLAGFAFTLAVFIMYFLYGLIIIKFFQIVQALTLVRLWIYKILGFFAILLGIFNIKDFIRYRPGGFMTEMPLSFRPKVKKIISNITSPKGAFGVGIFVTLFLLPCTIGPYIIAGGILSTYEIIKTIPPLLLYNLIFVLPMIVITLIVYLGFTTVEHVSGWKEKNIRYLHLIAGLIMLGLGIGIVFGLI